MPYSVKDAGTERKGTIGMGCVYFRVKGKGREGWKGERREEVCVRVEWDGIGEKE